MGLWVIYGFIIFIIVGLYIRYVQSVAQLYQKVWGKDLVLRSTLKKLMYILATGFAVWLLYVLLR